MIPRSPLDRVKLLARLLACARVFDERLTSGEADRTSMGRSRVFGTQTPIWLFLAVVCVHLSTSILMELAASMEYIRMHKLSQAASQESAMELEMRLSEADCAC